MLRQSPPTTSGIVVLSGSNNFGLGGDFPVFANIQIDYEAEDQRFDPIMELASSITANEVVTPRVLTLINLNDHEATPLHPLMFLASSITANEVVTPRVLDIKFDIEDDRVQTFLQFVPFGLDRKITSTSVTTSGIVILEFFPGADDVFVPYAPPIFINQRVFPVTFSGIGERLFPEENRRIYPVLPQFSVITPGD